MFARYTRYKGLDPGKVQPTIDAVTTRLLPAMEREPGCTDGFVLVDHQGGCVMTVTLWETEKTMHASEQAAARVRAEMDADAIDWRREPIIERYEIVLDRNAILTRGHAALAAQESAG